jgi:hypothetical protein
MSLVGLAPTPDRSASYGKTISLVHEHGSYGCSYQGCRNTINHDAVWQPKLPDPKWSVSWREVDPSKEG